jgi:hypothetical protein
MSDTGLVMQSDLSSTFIVGEPHGNLLLYLTEYGKIGTGHTVSCAGSFTEKGNYFFLMAAVD